MSKNTVYTVSDLLLDRLLQAGVHHIFGVPGDYSLPFVHQLCKHKIHYIGCCNELGAGYAADAYARINGIGCASFTYGVGELSAANAIAGSYCEMVPVIMLSGYPSQDVIDKNLHVHHCPNDLQSCLQSFKPITVHQVILSSPHTALQEIDEAISIALHSSRPVYIGLPFNLSIQTLSPPSSRFSLFPLPCNYLTPHYYLPQHNIIQLYARRIICSILLAKKPLLLLGMDVFRHVGLANCLLYISTRLECPFATNWAAKNNILETHKNCIGVYAESIGKSEPRAYIESADCLFLIGYPVIDYSATSGLNSVTESSACYWIRDAERGGLLNGKKTVCESVGVREMVECMAHQLHLYDSMCGVKKAEEDYSGWIRQTRLAQKLGGWSGTGRVQKETSGNHTKRESELHLGPIVGAVTSSTKENASPGREESSGAEGEVRERGEESREEARGEERRREDRGEERRGEREERGEEMRGEREEEERREDEERDLEDVGADEECGLRRRLIPVDSSKVLDLENPNISWVNEHLVTDEKWVGLMERIKNRTPKREVHFPSKDMCFRTEDTARSPRNQELTIDILSQQIIRILNDRDILLIDIGSLGFSFRDYLMPCRSILPGLYGSIGYTVGGTLGVAKASEIGRTRSHHLGDHAYGNIITLIGDGALQTAIQEISTIHKTTMEGGYNIVMVVVNNGGYAIERMILDGEYNDIPNWNYRRLCEGFGVNYVGMAVDSVQLSMLLDRALSDDSFTLNASSGSPTAHRGCFKIVEVRTPVDDGPKELMDKCKNLRKLLM